MADTNRVQGLGPDERYQFSIHLRGGAAAIAPDLRHNPYVVTYPPQVIKLAALRP